MTKAIVCDVCEETFPLDESSNFTLMELSGQWVNEEGSLSMDVCSPACLLQIANALTEPAQKPQPKRNNAQPSGPEDDGPQNFDYPEVKVR